MIDTDYNNVFLSSKYIDKIFTKEEIEEKGESLYLKARVSFEYAIVFFHEYNKNVDEKQLLEKILDFACKESSNDENDNRLIIPDVSDRHTIEIEDDHRFRISSYIAFDTMANVAKQNIISVANFFEAKEKLTEEEIREGLSNLQQLELLNFAKDTIAIKYRGEKVNVADMDAVYNYMVPLSVSLISFYSILIQNINNKKKKLILRSIKQ